MVGGGGGGFGGDVRFLGLGEGRVISRRKNVVNSQEREFLWAPMLVLNSLLSEAIPDYRGIRSIDM